MWFRRQHLRALGWFSASDRHCRMFRLLGLPTGLDISLAAAAVPAGITRREARRVLAELTRANQVFTHPCGFIQIGSSRAESLATRLFESNSKCR